MICLATLLTDDEDRILMHVLENISIDSDSEREAFRSAKLKLRLGRTFCDLTGATLQDLASRRSETPS